MGRIQDNSASNSSVPKKPFAGNGQRRREGETSVVYADRGRGRGRSNYYQDQVAAVTIPTPVPQPQYHPQQQPRYNNQQQGGNPGQQRHYQQRPRQTDRVIEPIPMPYSVLLPKLIDMNLVTLRTLAPPIDPNNFPRGYDVNARCAFHSNAPGHTTDNCKALQLKVQDLRDAQAINFAPVPNVIQNPMPAHGGQGINVVEVVEAGNAQGWGKFVEPVIKEDKFGLGYTLGSQKNEAGTFSSGGLVSPHIVNAADEDKADSDCDLDSWIRPCVPGEKLDNWSSEKTVRVTLLKE